MKKSIFKRSIAGMLAFAFLLTTMLSVGGTTAFAAGTQEKVYIVSFPRSGDVSSNTGSPFRRRQQQHRLGSRCSQLSERLDGRKKQLDNHTRHRRLRGSGLLLH